MIKTILIQNFRAYKGSNEIHWNENFRLPADVGPPDTGLSTMLDALAIASGRSDFSDEDTYSVVGVTLQDGSTFRRCASGPCLVNHREVKLRKYKRRYAKTLRELFTPWQAEFQDPKKTLGCMEDLEIQSCVESICASLHKDGEELRAIRHQLQNLEGLEIYPDLAELNDAIMLRRKENGEIVSRILAITAGRSVSQCEDSYMEKWNDVCVTLENNATKNFNAHVEFLKQSICKALVFYDLDRSSQFKGFIYSYELLHRAFDRVQSEYVADNAELDEKLSIVMKEMKFTNDHLSAQKILKQEIQSRIENEEQKGKEESIKAHLNKEPRTMESDIESLKLLYPGIVGTLKDFVTARQDFVDTPIGGAIETILREVAACKNDLTLVVGDAHKTNVYATILSTYGSRSLKFVPREEPDVHPVAESVPLEIAKEYPSACCLSSLLVTKSREEEHLKYLLADHYLVLPSPEACARVAEITSWGLCSSDGTHYRPPTNLSEESSALGVVVAGDDEEEQKILLAEQRLVRLSLKYRRVQMGERLENVDQEIAYLKSYLDKCMVVYNRLRKLYNRVIDDEKCISVEIGKLREFWKKFKAIHLISAKYMGLSKTCSSMKPRWQGRCIDMLMALKVVKFRNRCSPTTIESNPPLPTLQGLPENVATEVAKEAGFLCEGDRELGYLYFRRDKYKRNMTMQHDHRREVLTSKLDDLERRIHRTKRISEQDQ